MRRRDAIAGLGGLTAFGAAGWYATSGSVLSSDETDDAASDDTAAASGAGVAPVTVETLDAPHSSAGTMAVPVPEAVTVVDVFATWCVSCDEQLARLATVHEQVDEDVQFVSVTNEAIGGGLTRADIREFWANNAGRWPVALDDDGTLTTRLSVRGLPYTAVTDPQGRVVYRHSGVTAPKDVVAAIEDTRDA